MTMPTLHGRNRILLDQAVTTWDALIAPLEDRLPETITQADHPVFFAVADRVEALQAVYLGIRNRLDFGVVDAARLDDPLKDRLSGHGTAIVALGTGETFPPGSRAPNAVPGRVSVLTSGTTGTPKLVPHTAASLNTFDRVRTLQPNQWFVPYQVGSYAWYQMVSLGLFVEGQDLVPADFMDLEASFESALTAHAVTAISSTPTFWRHMMLALDPDLLAHAPLRSISLGGEIVDQPILDRLKALYPDAQIRHIYASSEAGAAIVVTDGQAGFDAALLHTEGKAIGLKIMDGHLHVRSPYGVTPPQDGWIDTGDLVEERDGRVFFRGRAGNTMINVGGQKAFPASIEARLLSHPNVLWARVAAQRAPLVGHLPVADIVLTQSMDPAEAETALTRHCSAALAEHAVPRLWNFLPEVPMRASLKS